MDNPFCKIIIFLFIITDALSQNIPYDTGKIFFENGQPTTSGSDVGMFSDTPTRLKIDLSGHWRYSIEGEQWKNIQVPGAYDFAAKVDFQRNFDITSQMIDKYNFLLVIYGIHYQSEIQINGTFIGRHMGGGTSFVLPIRENVLQIGSENVIKVFCDNRLTPTTTLPLRQFVGGQRGYGGILRDIYLLAVPKIYISETVVKSELSQDFKSSKLTVTAQIENFGFVFGGEHKENNFQVEVYDKLTDEPVGKSSIVSITVPNRKSKYVKAEVIIQTPKLWSPEMPDLYVVKCKLMYLDDKENVLIDEFIQNYGIRELKIEKNHFNLNGKSLYLKGVLWNEDHQMFGPSTTYEEMEKDIARIRSTGANLIRFLRPPHPYMINLCDRYGLFVIEEVPISNTPVDIIKKGFYLDLVQAYAREMVQRDRNNVSVLAWGIGNEIEFNQKSSNDLLRYLESVNDSIKTLDNRPVYLTLLANQISGQFDQFHELIDKISEKVEIISLNYNSNAIDGIQTLKKDLKLWKENHKDKLLIVGKYGIEIEPKNRNGYSDPVSLESQAWFAWHAFQEIKEMNFAGSVFWSFNDWRGDRPALSTPSGNPYVHSMGMISFDGERRIVFDVMRSVFNGEKVSALPVGNYSSGTPMVFVIAGLIILISLAFFYNSNRRFRENVHRSLFRSYNFYADVRDQRIIPVSHSIFLSIILSVTMAIILSSIFSHYRYDLLVDNILSQLLIDDVKEWLIILVWQEYLFIIYFSMIFIVLFVLLMAAVKFFSLFIRLRVYIYHAYSITVWSHLPMIILIPFSMIMFKVIQDPIYIIPSYIFIFVILFWSLLRLLKGMSIIYDINPIKIYLLGFGIILVSIAIIFSYIEYSFSSSVFLKYLLESHNIL